MASHDWIVKGKDFEARGRSHHVAKAWTAACHAAARRYRYPHRDFGPLTLTVNGVAVTVSIATLHSTVKEQIAATQ
jgi:hypothetical protein